ncbi:Hypothetical protein CINCED_3A001251 [Cinara cedri]|uniref:Uncharacterized protein n=1 Tax=Cinara cedri TaxID=506608 RepID=A0A5E4NEU3_9HEMI|nr:Hypothetical protein CINCED_3A001251 [Cinara cedri]
MAKIRFDDLNIKKQKLVVTNSSSTTTLESENDDFNIGLDIDITTQKSVENILDKNVISDLRTLITGPVQPILTLNGLINICADVVKDIENVEVFGIMYDEARYIVSNKFQEKNATLGESKDIIEGCKRKRQEPQNLKHFDTTTTTSAEQNIDDTIETIEDYFRKKCFLSCI